MPIAKARLSEVELTLTDPKAYQQMIDDAVGPGSTWMSYALNWRPQRQVDTAETYKIEASSKWIPGALEFGGSTAGPQQAP